MDMLWGLISCRIIIIIILSSPCDILFGLVFDCNYMPTFCRFQDTTILLIEKLRSLFYLPQSRFKPTQWVPLGPKVYEGWSPTSSAIRW